MMADAEGAPAGPAHRPRARTGLLAAVIVLTPCFVFTPCFFTRCFAAAQAPATLTLNEAIARALEANRTVLASRTARPIDVAGVGVAGERPNPDVAVEEDRETPHLSVAGTVPIETAGKRGKRLAAARATLAVTDATIARTAVQVRSDVRRAYYDAVASTRRLDIDQQLETVAGRARDAARERVQTGAAPRLEQLQAELALATAQNDSTLARGDVAAARASLNALLAFPADAAPALADPLEAGPLPSRDQAIAVARRSNADLLVLERQVDEARARLQLAQANRRPDPSVTGTFTYDSPPEFMYGWRLGMAIALPIFTTGKPDVAAAQATVDHAVALRDALSGQIAGAVAAAVARAASARQALDRYQHDILPASVQVEQMAEESYRSGQTGLPALLQALQNAREINLRALQAGIDYQTALTDLERAMGSPLE
ncbi:MAG TPA: TolC family protein [Vicinamibacterales bacterium]|nr:TolC family protein [Vicinamibacterales bacterium]